MATSVLRLGHFRKGYRKADGTKVKAAYVNKVTRKTKGKTRSQRKAASGRKVIPKLKSGTLRQFGYGSALPQAARREALKKAVKFYGKGSISKKLNAVYVLSRNRNPQTALVFYKDRQWVAENF
jgi:hypothetical protein